MAIDVYLALTGAELEKKPALPSKTAWMACHFAPEAEGITNCPPWLPPESLLILDDSIPLGSRDLSRICRELEALLEGHRCRALVLDLQRPGAEPLILLLQKKLPVPVILSQRYGHLGGPVLLPPIPPHRSPARLLVPWAGREIWLELESLGRRLRVDKRGTEVFPWQPEGEPRHRHRKLCCSYSICREAEAAAFLMQRTGEDLKLLLEACEALGAAGAIGLWQELPQWA